LLISGIEGAKDIGVDNSFLELSKLFTESPLFVPENKASITRGGGRGGSLDEDEGSAPPLEDGLGENEVTFAVGAIV
jgi:hypothetical protein